MMLRKSCWTAAVAFCLTFLFAIPAMAQEGTGKEVTEAELEKAAKAYVKIAMLNQEFQEEVQKTAEQEERQKLQNETQDKMVDAVKAANLDVEEYNNIMNTVSADEAVAERFRSKVQEIQ